MRLKALWLVPLLLGGLAPSALAGESVDLQMDHNPQYQLDLTPKSFVLVRGHDVLHESEFAEAIADVAPDMARRIRVNALNGAIAQGALWGGVGLAGLSVGAGAWNAVQGNSIAALPGASFLSLYTLGVLVGGLAAAGGWASGHFFHQDGRAYSYREAASSVNAHNNLLQRIHSREYPIKILTDQDLKQ